ncbi:hypothetical protein F751_0509 [Auxenochlorella protothecoides]|uniref:K Homology domain-containing protein n=1 Tax=Auxenochlorella protothecoides TaxID=3075 RepID=A0A087SIC8_AUXPR|nr:hypothetical protein F751_0509 [Auxenochlorella protothecoides]KFM25482.1 hypothetical protein F751_0509 [Auxenochlorella protothecoides]RMZ54649.1 hypothetical protein APUTEX25_003027 [Auxenochlorella protothecoides]|eukprot:RMZ54649.1 hypothetical protein APUTEX25_003027 [Auxenochlorella protothecoides]
MRGEGCDEDEQGVVSAEMTGEGSAKLRITLLAAGFVIGPSGASVREITHRTGSSIRSWNENVKVRGKDRKVRTLIIEGPPCSIQMALQIISGAVARYKDLCEGAFCGQAVDRVQVIGSVDFMYQPPPRHAVPFAASLRADSDSMARGWNRKHPRSPISPAGNKENLQAGDAGAFKCSIKNPGWAALVPGCGLPPVKEPSPPPPMPATPLFDSQLCMPEQYPWSMLQASAHLAALGRACEDGNVAPSARCQDVTPMRLDFGLGAHSAAETGPWDASLLLSSKPCPDVRAPHSRTQAPAFSLFGPLTGYEGQHLANLSHGSPPSGPTAQSVLAAQLDALNRQALELARVQDYEASRQAFENTIQMCPNLETAWVSWAQMEKRCGRSKDGILRSRAVLQKALALNPSSPRLCQAWGLLELQRGNWTAASLLIERAVLLDASLAPVLKWRAVETARKLAQEAHAAKGRPTLQSNAS